MESLEQKLQRTLNRLAKWRAVFTGWQIGTCGKEDPEAQAIRDHREATLILRAEVSALVGLLIKQEVFTLDEWMEQLIEEADALDVALSQRFPGIRSSDDGMVYDGRAIQTNAGVAAVSIDVRKFKEDPC